MVTYTEVGLPTADSAGRQSRNRLGGSFQAAPRSSRSGIRQVYRMSLHMKAVEGPSQMSSSVSRRRALALSAGVLASPMVASGVARAADEWPNKPVKYINVFPAGGPTDTLSRIVCAELSEMTGQQFIVDNKAGSGGNVGTDAIAKSPNDGYTIGLYTIASQSIAPTLYAKLPFDVEKDFAAVAMLWSVPNMLMTRLELPAKTVPELIELARANPGKYSFASSGAGTTPHITGELFKQLAKVNLLHVPY